MTHDEKKPSIDSLIDANLRRVYADVLQEEVPDRFTALLDQLRAAESGEAGTKGASDDADPVEDGRDTDGSET